MNNRIKKYKDFKTSKDMFGNIEYPQVDDRFWEFVEKINWRVAGIYDYDYIVKVVSPHFSKKEFKEFEKVYDKLSKYLDTILRDVWLGEPGLDVSDDGYSDLLSSIIGFGKKFFYKVLKNHFEYNSHELLHDIIEKREYHENFGYIFHILDSKPHMDKWEYNGE